MTLSGFPGIEEVPPPEEIQIKIKHGPFAETPCWNDFLNELYKTYPLKHRACVDPRDQIKARVAAVKINSERRTLTDVAPINVYRK